jgi:ATP-dependent Clp protease adaptor protein ClpS
MTAEQLPGTTPTIITLDEEKTQLIQPWNVVLFDDQDHMYEYVITMLCKVLGVSSQAAGQMAREVDTTGRVIVFTGSRERCELIQEQIHNWGADPLIPWCRGSMSAVIEEAE